MQIQTVQGVEYLYVTTTTTNEVYRLDLKTNTISVFANRSTIDLATGLPVGSALASPDNLAIDHDGNIYIVEDRQRWRRRRHLVRQGPEQGRRSDRSGRRHRRAGPPTAPPGSEFTGLYFDPTDKRRAWVNIQHPASGNDRTIEITLP